LLRRRSLGCTAARQLIHQTSTRGQNQALHYDAAGQLVRIDDAGTGKVSTYVYDLSGRHLRETTVQGGVTYQDNRIAYDALGRLRWVDASGLTVNIDYDLAGNRTHVARQVNTGTGAEALVQTSQENYAYDAMNRQTMVQTLYAASNVPAVDQTHTLAYDLSGNRTSDTSTVAHAAWINGAWTPMAEGQAQTTETYAYDSLGRLSSTHRDGVLVDARRYDGASRALASGAVLGAGGMSYEYALAHNLATGELLQYRQSSYDGHGRLAQQNLIEFSRLFAPAPGASSTITSYAYDAAGNMRESTSVTLDASGATSQGRTLNAYERAEGYRLANSLTGSASEGGSSQGGLGYHYDANGHLATVSNPGQLATVNPELTQHRYVNDAQGRVLYSDYTLGDPQAAQHAQRQLIVNGEVLGRYGQAADLRYRQNYTGDPAVLPAIFTGAADLSLGYQPIAANYPANAPGSYSVGTGDTLQSIAKASYGDARLWYLIADANGLSSNADLQPGQVLRIPAVVTSANSADTFRPYDPSKIASDSPSMMAMPQSQDGGCGGIGQVIMAVVTVVVAYYTGVYIGAESVAGYAAAGAVGSIAGQAVGVAIGAQESFSWKQVALAAIGGGVTAGLSGVEFVADSVVGNAIVRGALANAASQGIAVVTGLQDKSDWRSVAASAVSAGVGQGLNAAMDYYPGQQAGMNGVPADAITNFDLGRSLVSGIGGSVVGQAARGGKISAANIAADAFGNALGDSIAAANGQQAQGVGPWSDADYRNGSDIQSDNAALQRQSQPYYDQIVGAFDQSGDGNRYVGVQLAAASGYSGMGLSSGDRDQNIVRMLDLANGSGVNGRLVNAGEADGLVDLSPTRVNAMRLGLMGPNGQTEGVWVSPMDLRPLPVGTPLPPLDAYDRNAYIAAAALGGEFSVLSADLPPDIASGYAGPAGAMVRDPVGTYLGLQKSGYNNTFGGLAGLTVKGGAYLEAGDMLMSGAILGIDTRDEAMAIMGIGRAGEKLILAQPNSEGQQVGMALGDTAAAMGGLYALPGAIRSVGGMRALGADNAIGGGAFSNGMYVHDLTPLSNTELYGQALTRTPAEAVQLLERVGHDAEMLKQYNFVKLSEAQYKRDVVELGYEFDARYGMVRSDAASVSFRQNIASTNIDGSQRIPVYVRGGVFDSDEAIVQVLSHEIYEVEALRREAASSLSVSQYRNLVRSDRMDNLHYQAVEDGDAWLRIFRGINGR